MTADRSRAYSRVMTILDDLAAAKLHTDEQTAIREAADALLFCDDVARDDDARRSLDRVVDLIERMVEVERLMPETGEAILDAVEGCGPHPIAA
jgi:hypothetical protein